MEFLVWHMYDIWEAEKLHFVSRRKLTCFLCGVFLKVPYFIDSRIPQYGWKVCSSLTITLYFSLFCIIVKKDSFSFAVSYRGHIILSHLPGQNNILWLHFFSNCCLFSANRIWKRCNLKRWNFSVADKHTANGSGFGLPAWRWCTGFCGWQTGWGLPSACSCFARGPWANGLNVWTESPRSLLPTRPAFLPAKHKNTESSEDTPHRPEEQRLSCWSPTEKCTKTTFHIPHLNKSIK